MKTLIFSIDKQGKETIRSETALSYCRLGIPFYTHVKKVRK